MNNKKMTSTPEKTAIVPEKMRLWVKFKQEHQQANKQTGELRTEWFWNSQYLIEYFSQKYKMPKPLSSYKAVQWKFSFIFKKCAEIRIYDLSDNTICFHWFQDIGEIENKIKMITKQHEVKIAAYQLKYGSKSNENGKNIDKV